MAPFLLQTLQSEIRRRLPPLSARQWQVLLLVSSATFFDYYDIILISLALKQIQTELLIDEAYIGLVGAVVQFGKIPAIFVSLIADRFGRRPVLLWTIVAYTLLTGLTAFATGAVWFALLQFGARIFATAEIILAHVVVAEEIEPRYRGWGIGLMGTIAGLGSGMAYVLFGFVDVIPGGWRGLYFIGLFPLVLLIFLRRGLPETTRFADAHAEPGGAANDFWATTASHLKPLLDLVRMYPGRFAVTGLATFFVFFAQEVGYFFTPKFLQENHGWKPYYLSMLAPLGVFGIMMNVVGGWMGDRFGRRQTLILFILLMGSAGLVLFNGDGFILLAAAVIGLGGFSAAVRTNLFVFTAELFPTSYRSTAGGGIMILNSLGGMLGLGAESLLYRLTGSHAIALTIIIAALAPAALAVWFIPETAGRSLEDIAPEKDR